MPVGLEGPRQLRWSEEVRGLLPPLSQIGDVADLVALAVARQAVAEGLAPPLDDEEIVAAVERRKWTPRYRAVTST